MYVVVVFGVTVIVEPVAPPGDHVNVPPGTVDVAVNVDCWPAHTVSLVTVTTGTGFTVTVTGVSAEAQLIPDQVIRTYPLPALPVMFPPLGLGIEAFPGMVFPPKTPPR